MKNKDESYKKLVEFLWVEINRAILSSPNVKATLSNLRELGLLEEVSEYNLVVDVNKMVDMMLDKPENTEKLLLPQKNADTPRYQGQDDSFEEDSFSSESDEKPKAQETVGDARQYIDGQPLSKSQIFFQAYQEQKFDTVAWLKKARIRF